MSPVAMVAWHLREAGLGGNSTDPSFYDEKAEMLEAVAVQQAELAGTARTFASAARDRATEIRSGRRGRR